MAFSAGLTVQIKLPFNRQTSNFSISIGGNKRVQKLKLQLSHRLHQTHITPPCFCGVYESGAARFREICLLIITT